MTRHFPVITKKVVFYIIAVNVLLCSLVFTSSYLAFDRQFKEQYDTEIQDIAEAARSFLNPEDFEKYKKEPVPDEKWYAVIDDLQRIVDNFNLNVIYVSAVDAPDYTHIFYFYDPVGKVTKWTPYPLGYEEDYFEPSYHATTVRVYEEGASLVRHTIKSRSGSHITAQLPVYDSSGKIVALIGAQKNVQEFVDAKLSFIKNVIITILIAGICSIVFFALYFNINYIKPVLLITKETNRFASNNDNPAEDLLSIKKRNELGTLAKSVYQMENVVHKNIEALTKMTTETATALASAIDAKDTYTHGHSTRVAEYSREIAKRAGKTESECRDLYIIALLHDVGKIGIPNSIINKEGKLTPEEYEIIKNHPKIGNQILKNITQIPHISDGAHYHHERYDGKGYPEGLAGNAIPEIGRIIAVADAYDAMTSNRSYRKLLTQENARSEIEKGMGTQFDPTFAKIMLAMIDEDKDFSMREMDN